MATQHTHEVSGAPDIELGTPRVRPVCCTVSVPSGHVEVDALPGLVFFIPGFGQDNDAGYISSFAGWIADTYGFGCVAVEYHAHACRPGNGAQRRFTQPDADRLVGYCQEYGVTVGENPSPGTLIEQLHEAYAAHVAAGRASGVLTLTCGLVARDGERQNFGLMQAMDYLHVLADLRGRLDYDRRNVIAIGSSHGGYLAQLIAKLAPNMLRAVFDNSGYATAPLRYINGREQQTPDYIERYSPAMQMHFYLESMWSFKERQANFYHADARAIRSLMQPEHLATMAAAGGRRTRYRCVHGLDDPIAPTQEKAEYCQRLIKAGFDAHYQCMGPTDIDGRYVKSLDHGMGLSLRGFFERSYASLQQADIDGHAVSIAGDDFDLGTRISYPGPERTYRLTYENGGLSASLA